MDTWQDTCSPCIDEASVLPWHRGGDSIPPFQTHSRYFYAPLGENCCGRHFVDLFYQQHHPFPHCCECARLMLEAASHICWQCRTYFRRYGTGQIQQIVGITPQRFGLLDVRMPERGQNQRRLPEEQQAQQWRDDCLDRLRPPIMQMLLPQESSCTFWGYVTQFIAQFGNQRCLTDLPTIPMPYYNEEALLPLPPSPEDGFRAGLSLYPEVIDTTLPADEDRDEPTPQD